MPKASSLCQIVGILICACISWFALYSDAIAEPFILGRIVGITDGDTLVLLDDTNKQHKIRLAGIDAPEKNQPFGQASKEYLSQQAYNRLASADCPKVDRYGREICIVTIDGHDINIRQIQEGMAWHYKKYEGEQPLQQRHTYANVEVEARAKVRGLWADQSPIAPWDWRRQKSR